VAPHPYLDAPLPLALAHRGGAGLPANDGIENTLTAFRNAVALGYVFLETDVHVSADGVVYAFHDDHLGRMTGVETPIADLTSAEIDRTPVAGREPVPRLADLLATLPDARFNIDVKADGAVGPTVEVVEAAGAASRVCLASFSGRRLLRLRRLCPDAARSAGPLEIAALKLGPVRWVRRLAARRGVDCLQVPVRRGPLTVVTPRFVRRAHDTGLQVHVWTVDDPAEMRHLLEIGVDGIVTDRPDVLRDVLTERGTWPDEHR
jgi:glycerophosphoryl diester phosphodiesterase